MVPSWKRKSSSPAMRFFNSRHRLKRWSGPSGSCRSMRRGGWARSASARFGRLWSDFAAVLPLAIDDPALGQIVGRKLDVDLVARNDADEVLTHLARDMGHHFAAGVELHAETRIGEGLCDRAANDERFFFGCHRVFPSRGIAKTPDPITTY